MQADPERVSLFYYVDFMVSNTKTKEVMDHGKITAGFKERSQKAEEQKEIAHLMKSGPRR